MARKLVALGLSSFVCAFSQGASGPAHGRDADFARTVKPLVAKYCVDCHGADTSKGDLDLEALADGASLERHRETWEKVFAKLRHGEMPPKDEPRPAAEEARALVQWLAAEFKRQDDAAPVYVGRVAPRRLNRSEYNNTVRDLLGVNVQPADDFPPDDSGYGFDNNGDVLSLSPLLMEKYLKAAEKVARTAVYGVEPLKPSSYTHQPWYIDFETNGAVKLPYDETGLSLPYSLHVMHRFPVDGEYELTGFVRGFKPNGSDPCRLGFWIDGKLVGEGLVPVPPGGEMNGLYTKIRVRVPAGEHWMSVSLLKIFEGLPPVYGGPNPAQERAPARGPEFEQGAAPDLGLPPGQGQVADQGAPPGRGPVAGRGRGGRGRGGQGRGGQGAPRLGRSPTEHFIQNLVVNGPFNQTTGPSPESLKKLYGNNPLPADDKVTPARVREIVGSLARRAYRRPVMPAEVNELVGLVERVQKEGDSFKEGLTLALTRMLVSPHFLFRIERDPPANAKAPQPIAAHELATRLSYFLWSSMPDDELMRLADEKKLDQPAVLDAQVKRMLRDPKAFALVEDFGGQWLQFRALESHTVERKAFQHFTEYTKLSMQWETEKFFEHIMRDDRSVLDFVEADYSFLNQRMADYYGVPGVEGAEFRKVTLPPDSRRRGVMTHASVLTVSSYANRTSPVLRGKYILENILNSAPPPPPGDVPSLEDAEVGTLKSMREQLEAHRAQPVCASCHVRMDPLGFGLENFDAVGLWRDTVGKLPVDPSGALPDGRTFSGPLELAAILKMDKEDFAECISDKLLTYALGRGLKIGDRASVRRIAGQLPANDYRFSSLVLGIVNSPQFRLRATAAAVPKT